MSLCWINIWGGGGGGAEFVVFFIDSCGLYAECGLTHRQDLVFNKHFFSQLINKITDPML